LRASVDGCSSSCRTRALHCGSKRVGRQQQQARMYLIYTCTVPNLLLTYIHAAPRSGTTQHTSSAAPQPPPPLQVLRDNPQLVLLYQQSKYFCTIQASKSSIRFRGGAARCCDVVSARQTQGYAGHGGGGGEAFVSAGWC
jgi:hypothetical protein